MLSLPAAPFTTVVGVTITDSKAGLLLMSNNSSPEAEALIDLSTGLLLVSICVIFVPMATSVSKTMLWEISRSRSAE